MRKTMTRLTVFVTLAACSAVFGVIENTPHDLTAVAGGNPCGYCHTPHGAMAGTPLWNHKLSNAVYKIYQSTSLEADVGQPTGSSKLCLSCHDGTVALTESITGAGAGGAYIPPGAANLGTDLSDDHPISFVYSSSLASQDRQIRPPEMISQQLALDRDQELQCTTCHDPHDNRNGDFLVLSNRQSALCRECHDIDGWAFSSHQNSSAPIIAADDPYLQASPYSTLIDIGCGGCHQSHSAGGAQRLLHFASLDENCLNCHNGSVALSNLEPDLTKIYGHDSTRYEGVHDLREEPLSMPMHVECVDCHNPHAARRLPAEAPAVQGAMRGASGITSAGAYIETAQFEYEVCYKCHADNPNRVRSPITRQITQTNTRLEFDLGGPSFHPVQGGGVNPNVPSLLQPWTVASIVYCTDCHSSDPTGTQGPHGSIYRFLLSERYETTDFTQESPYTYALCYKCHSRNSIFANVSFSSHREHVRNGAPCSICHDAHGISAAQGNSTNNSHLMNFDISIVAPDPVTGIREFQDTGTFSGRCFLLCHGVAHSPRSY